MGAPWTLLVYMLDLKDKKKKLDQNRFHEERMNLNKIIDHLIKYLKLHIKNQIEAGADVVQIFDSWAGLLPENMINDLCYVPNLKLVEFCRNEKISNICFPKGINKNYENFNNLVKPDGINIDSNIDPIWAKKKLKNVVIQGGLDPNVLLKSEEEIMKGATKYINSFRDFPYVFNLGHGLLPETDPDKVEMLIKFYRNSK